jgi:hypothetical protein
MNRRSFLFGVAALPGGWAALAAALARAAPEAPRPVPPGCGVLKGTVRLVGERPDLDKRTAEIRRQMDAGADRERFRPGKVPPEEREQQAWRIGKDGELANVQVWLEPAPGTFFALDDRHPGVRAARGELVVRMPNGQFRPHTLFVFPRYADAEGRAAATGQRLVFVNDSAGPENVRYSGDALNLGANLLLTPGQRHVADDLRPALVPVDVASSLHPWMRAWVRVVDHPFYAVTDEAGRYEIRNVPIGAVRVYAWHEEVGYLNAGRRDGEPIELKDGSTVTKDFTARKAD